MASNKQGFNYWSVETDRYQDIKIKKLKKEFKAEGVGVFDYILNEIYRVKGSFMQWDESTVFDVAEYFGIKETTVQEIVNYCCYVGLFEKRLLIDERVLTSKAIQDRFIDWSEKAKRKLPKIPEKYFIIQEECNIIPEECSDYSGRNKQRKVKESKGKEKEETPAPSFLNPDEVLEKKINEMLVPEMLNIWKQKKPHYYSVEETDFHALLEIAYHIAAFKKWKRQSVVEERKDELLKSWAAIVDFIVSDNWFSDKNTSFFAQQKNWQELANKMIEKKNGKEPFKKMVL